MEDIIYETYPEVDYDQLFLIIDGYDEVLPENLCASLREGIVKMGQKLEGFDAPDAVLTAVESRATSPVRIVRGEDFQSCVRGLYPIGEGAGYAGGIMSSAMDGMKAAEAYFSYLSEEN